MSSYLDQFSTVEEIDRELARLGEEENVASQPISPAASGPSIDELNTVEDIDKEIERLNNELSSHQETPPQQEVKPPQFEGLLEAGTIDLTNRPVIKNDDGSVSTELSFSFEDNGVEILVPQIVNGEILSKKEAIRHFDKTGEHLGKFDSVEAANKAAEAIHNRGTSANQPLQKEKPGFLRDAWSALKRGEANKASSINRAIELAGSVTGSESLREAGKHSGQYWEEKASKLPRPDYMQQGVIEGLKENPVGTLAILGIENIPSFVTLFGLGGIGFKLFGKVGSVVVGGAGAFGLESGASFGEAMHAGAPDDEAEAAAAITGAVNAMIEFFPAGRLLSKRLGKEAAEGLLKRVFKQGIIEGSTEGLQEFNSVLANKLTYDPKVETMSPDNLERYLEAVLGGGVLGAGVGVIAKPETTETEDALKKSKEERKHSQEEVSSTEEPIVAPEPGSTETPSTESELVQTPPRREEGATLPEEEVEGKVLEPTQEAASEGEKEYAPYEKAKIAADKPLPESESKNQSIALPEIAEMAKELLGGKYPKIKKLIGRKGVLGALIHKKGTTKKEMQLLASLPRLHIHKETGKVISGEKLASYILAHEIGHLVDHLPDHILRQRGNILGRIASLKKHLLTTVGPSPASPEGITVKERKKIHNDLVKATIEELGGTRKQYNEDKDFKEAVNTVVKDSFEQHIEDIVQERKLFKEEVITEELKKVTQFLAPFNPDKEPDHAKYRYKSSELYAEAISLLVNDPAALKELAPTFHKAFHAWLDKKPQVKATYKEIQERVKNPGKVHKHREEKEHEGFEKAREARSRQFKKDKEIKEGKSWLDSVITSLIDKHHPILKRAKSVKNLNPEENPRYWLEMAEYISAKLKEYMSQVYDKAISPLESKGISLDYLADVIFHDRVIHERGELWNPRGFTPRTSQEYLDKVESNLSKEKWQALNKAVFEFRKLRQTHVIPFIKESEMFSPILMEKIENNIVYGTFNVAEAIEKEGRSDSIPSYIHKQLGTLHEIESPFEATIMKDLALIRAANIKMSTYKTVSFLKKHSKEEAIKADYIKVVLPGKGVVREPSRSKMPKGYELVTYLHEGKVEGFYVPEDIAQVLKKAPSKVEGVTKLAINLNLFFKYLFVISNPGFWLFNLVRDFKRMMINLPGYRLDKMMAEYMKAIKPAFKEAYGVSDKTISDMRNKRMLISIEDRHGLSEEDTTLERLLQTYHITEKKWNNRVIAPFATLFDKWNSIGKAIEVMPKVAGRNFLKQNTSLSEIESGHVVRSHVGSPDFLRRGRAHKFYNNLFLFSNAMKEGWRGDFEVAKQRPMEYMMKRIAFTVIPKIAMYAIILGMFGDEDAEIMENASEFDLTNYIIIPIGKDENGKAIYIRIPQDETGRFLGGVLWKGLMGVKEKDRDIFKSLQGLGSYTAGQTPTLTPSLSMAWDVIHFAFGKNPHDWFKGDKAINEKVFRAGGKRLAKEEAKYLWNKGGGGIVYRPKQGSNIETIKSDLEKMIDVPVSQNIIGRFVKVSNVGKKQKYRKVSEEVRGEVARKNLDVRDRVIKTIEEKGEAGWNKLYGDLVREGLLEHRSVSRKQFRTRYMRYFKRRYDNPHENAMVYASTNTEKIELLKTFSEDMSDEKLDSFIRQMRREGFLSGRTAYRFRKIMKGEK
ncbi:MAG: hypothetical protein Unbinned7913contig1002_25 [Prokaryotic dsDNA virus sp.]|nr:MAG: hypothetical protein Unbinned7913contig1002_25 [Prokaryotic dsDNA virus sp.]